MVDTNVVLMNSAARSAVQACDPLFMPAMGWPSGADGSLADVSEILDQANNVVLRATKLAEGIPLAKDRAERERAAAVVNLMTSVAVSGVAIAAAASASGSAATGGAVGGANISGAVISGAAAALASAAANGAAAIRQSATAAAATNLSVAYRALQGGILSEAQRRAALVSVSSAMNRLAQAMAELPPPILSTPAAADAIDDVTAMIRKLIAALRQSSSSPSLWPRLELLATNLSRLRSSLRA